MKDMGALTGATGVPTEAVITGMDRPLGRAVGNALEIRECIETLAGHGPADLMAVVEAIGVAHEVSRQSAALALGGSAVAGLLGLSGRSAGAGPSIATVNAAAALAVANGARAGSRAGAVEVPVYRPVPLWQHVMAGPQLYDLFVDDDQRIVNPELVRLAREEQRNVRHGHGPEDVTAVGQPAISPSRTPRCRTSHPSAA